MTEPRPKLASEPLLRRGDWVAFVNQPMTDAEVEAVRRSIRRGRPLGSETWAEDTARRLGLEFSMRSHGSRRAHNGSSQNP